MVKASNIHVYKLRHDGFGCTCVETAIYYPRFLSDPLLDRDLRSFPHLSQTAPRPFLAESSFPYHPSDYGCMGRRVRHSDRRWYNSIRNGNHTRLQFYDVVYGYLLLVVDRSPEIQERDPWPLGPSKTNHPPAMGLKSFDICSLAFELPFS
jgi:hypothetical protein